MSISLALRALVVLLVSCVCARALFANIETEQVPIDRVMQNPQNRLAADTNNVEVLYQLARVHSMAFSSNLSGLSVTKEEKIPVFVFLTKLRFRKRFTRAPTLKKNG